MNLTYWEEIVIVNTKNLGDEINEENVEEMVKYIPSELFRRSMHNEIASKQ